MTKRDFERLLAQMARNSQGLRKIRETMATKMATKDDINRILTVLDDLVGTWKACWNKLVVHDHRIAGLEERCPPGR